MLIPKKCSSVSSSACQYTWISASLVVFPCITYLLYKSSTEHVSKLQQIMSSSCTMFLNLVSYLSWCYWMISVYSWWSGSYLRKNKVYLPEHVYSTNLVQYDHCNLFVGDCWQRSLPEDHKHWTRMTLQIWGYSCCSWLL